ncbi:hypothetical protein [Corynebacterium pacaense]|uniref:hypothetical protein n=1 Tax=Corynebacterium pacaense TaxID=1816684 RepID=UPI0009BAB9EB|nr:hypothetical protein [Corynebacterium pacaense]
MSADSARAASSTSKLRSVLAALLLLIPVLGGTIFAAATDLDISRAWAGEDEITGAPAPAVANSQALIDARRAAGEAGTQAGFLVSGTDELTRGTQQLVDGATPLTDGMGSAADGAKALHDGLVQLQAGTGQLGSGATEIADGVEGAVEQLNGYMVVQQQLVAVMDQADKTLADSKTPEAEQLRGQLADLRRQIQQFGLSVGMTDQLNDLRSGTRDLANQLAVPGYGFHDGIYSATNGAAELSSGLSQLEEGVDKAVNGFSTLDEGAERLDSMATAVQDKTGAVQRALPVVQATGAEEGATGQAGEDGRSMALAPMYAFLIATLVMLGGAAIGWATLKNRLLTVIVLLGITALGGIVLFTVAFGMSPAVLAASSAVLLLATVVGAILTRVMVQLFGGTAAVVLGVVGWLLQVAVVAHVWSVQAVSEISTLWRALAGIMPLHYPTFALVSLGNDGAQSAIWMSVAVLVAVGVIGGVILRITRRRIPA